MSGAVQDNFDTPPVWNNQNLIVYHGTTVPAATAIAAGQIDVTHGDRNKDFGQGFYTTTVRKQAESWARTLVVKRRMKGLHYEAPAIVLIVVPRTELASLITLAFTLGLPNCGDFWSFIRHNRRISPDYRLLRQGAFTSYDVVSGPLVADWKSRETYRHWDQISFHTPHAESFLNNHTLKQMIEVT